jgi:UPF0716 protein FxsA
MSLLLRLIILFVGLPILELMLLHKLSAGSTGRFGATLLLVLATGVAGAAMARRQGLRAWQRIATALANGQAPTFELLEGGLILAAGLLLITPGLITDAVGFSLLIPACRRLWGRLLVAWFKRNTVVRFQSFGFPPQGGPRSGHTADDDVIDVEFTRTDDRRRL